MLLKDMFDRVITETGQFFVDPVDLEVDYTRFARLVRSVLGLYNRHSPIRVQMNFTTQSDSKIVFTDEFQHPTTGVLLGKPAWVSSATPIRGRSNLAPYFAPSGQGRLGSSASGFGAIDLVDKQPTPFDYRAPTLYLAYPGMWDLKLQYHHKVVGDSDDTMAVDTITEAEDVFFDLLAAKFLISLGRNRRAFTLQPLELVSDADSTVSDAEAMFKDAKENLITNYSNFADAWD